MAKVLMKPQTSIVHMVISPVSKLNEIRSPDVCIHGIPWQVKVHKDEDSLAVHLHCAVKDKSSNWTVAARATIKLSSFSHKKNAVKKYIEPYVFKISRRSCGTYGLIGWDELLNDENKYVKNDAIQLKVEIKAENPNCADRAVLKFEPIDKCCDRGSHATFRLSVTNVENLLAVRSPQFILRGLPWALTVYKSQASTLGVMLSNESSKEASCEMEMSVKLLSTNGDMDPIVESDDVDNSEYLDIESVISWDKMMKSKNVYVKKNSITLEVKLKAAEPEGDVPNVSQTNAAKRRRLECSICLEDMDDQDTSATQCGHMFCTACITTAIRNRRACPMCQKAVQSLQRIYLPV